MAARDHPGEQLNRLDLGQLQVAAYDEAHPSGVSHQSFDAARGGVGGVSKLPRAVGEHGLSTCRPARTRAVRARRSGPARRGGRASRGPRSRLRPLPSRLRGRSRSRSWTPGALRGPLRGRRRTAGPPPPAPLPAAPRAAARERRRAVLAAWCTTSIMAREPSGGPSAPAAARRTLSHRRTSLPFFSARRPTTSPSRSTPTARASRSASS